MSPTVVEPKLPKVPSVTGMAQPVVMEKRAVEIPRPSSSLHSISQKASETSDHKMTPRRHSSVDMSQNEDLVVVAIEREIEVAKKKLSPIKETIVELQTTPAPIIIRDREPVKIETNEIMTQTDKIP